MQGVGNVGIETLFGQDPNYETSGYYPTAITPYGYDWSGTSHAQGPCALGALNDAIKRGNSIIVKLQFPVSTAKSIFNSSSFQAT